MSISPTELKLIKDNPGNPLVGLINKTTKEMVFALCIPQKVLLNLDCNGAAVSGSYLSDRLQIINHIEATELTEINLLLKQNYLPRLVSIDNQDLKSAHEILFEQKCSESLKSDWGGFSITLSETNSLSYNFVSGAFNSGFGKRTTGATLSWDLIDYVTNLVCLVASENNAELPQETGDLTPPQANNLLFFSQNSSTTNHLHFSSNTSYSATFN